MFFREQSFSDKLWDSLRDIFVEKNWALDNIIVCMIVYLTLWHMFKVMKSIERENKKLLTMFEENKTKQDDLILLKDKQREYEDVVIKGRALQKVTSKQLDDEVQRLIGQLMTTAARLTELEVSIKKPAEKCAKYLRVGDGAAMPDECSEGPRIVEVDALQEDKILEPSFPPQVPADPPPRKYGVFVSRPFSKQRGPSTSAAPTKIGFK